MNPLPRPPIPLTKYRATEMYAHTGRVVQQNVHPPTAGPHFTEIVINISPENDLTTSHCQAFRYGRILSSTNFSIIIINSCARNKRTYFPVDCVAVLRTRSKKYYRANTEFPNNLLATTIFVRGYDIMRFYNRLDGVGVLAESMDFSFFSKFVTNKKKHLENLRTHLRNTNKLLS